ncbi:protein phosphatase 2C domain-containing protein [Treponema primitia]|uniref:PP2C family serine/threonine-protein phosphatase n=1 Tax=Treponema primitia TaxID=88058 RepID=UPI003980F8CE
MNNYRSFSITAKGRDHVKVGKECQDYSDHYEDDSISLSLVADGHGDDNCFRSGRGAAFAVKCAKKGIFEFVRDINKYIKNNSDKNLTRFELEKLLKERLVASVCRSWHVKVIDDIEKHPLTNIELAKTDEKYLARYSAGEKLHHIYGTTLLAAVVTQNYWFGFHIGDGRWTALYKGGEFDQPVPWDDRCYLNVTTSLSDEDAAETARVVFWLNNEKKPPAVIFLCSDGVDDNYPVNENDKHLFRKVYRKIALCFSKDGFDSTCKQLEELVNLCAAKWKGDDTSIAGIVDLETIKSLKPIYERQIAEEKTITEPINPNSELALKISYTTGEN